MTEMDLLKMGDYIDKFSHKEYRGGNMDAEIFVENDIISN